MKITMLSARTGQFTVPSLAILGAMLAGAAALAQPVEEITIIAPHQVHRKTVGRTTIGAPIEEISLSHKVDYTDLDLRKPDDLATLKARIADMAKEGCDELDQLFPLDKDRDKNKQCVRDATAQAQAQLTAAIQSASAKAK
jgi:UrcA family protein